MLNVTIHTDGSCSGNPGVGGYGAFLVCNGNERKVCGYSVKTTTNNKMELTAVIEAVKWLNRVQKAPCQIEVHTDSKYIVDCISHNSKKWFIGRPNEDLWVELITVVAKGKHKITFEKVKGHSGDKYNELADKLAKEQCTIAKHQLLKLKGV